jgi:ABC-2 type transport system permease protein
MSCAAAQRMILSVVMRSLEYRGFLATLMFEQVLGPLVTLLIWLTLSDQGARLPYDRGQLISYYVMLSAVSMITGHWAAEYVAEEIRMGGLSPFLLRPMPYIAVWACDAIGQKLLMLALLLPQLAVVGLVFRGELQPPPNPWLWPLFLISLALATSFAFLLQFAMGLLAFWVEDIGGIRRVEGVTRAFLSGALIPLALFPAWLKPFLELQPYRYALSFPLEVLTRELSAAELAGGFGCQALYTAAAYLVYRLLWRRGLRRYAATGA